MAAMKIEFELAILTDILIEAGFEKSPDITMKAIKDITKLRDRIDELGGYHDDI